MIFLYIKFNDIYVNNNSLVFNFLHKVCILVHFLLYIFQLEIQHEILLISLENICSQNFLEFFVKKLQN